MKAIICIRGTAGSLTAPTQLPCLALRPSVSLCLCLANDCDYKRARQLQQRQSGLSPIESLTRANSNRAQREEGDVLDGRVPSPSRSRESVDHSVTLRSPHFLPLLPLSAASSVRAEGRPPLPDDVTRNPGQLCPCPR